MMAGGFMGKVYQSVRGMVQGTLNRKKIDLTVSAQPNVNPSLDDAMEELEKAVVNGIDRLKAAVSDEQAEAAGEVQQAKQDIEGLRAKIDGLEAQLREAQETVQRKEADSQKIEESLGVEIRDLHSAVKQKEDALRSREAEVSDLQAKTDTLTGQVTALESAVEQAKRAAATEAQRAEQVIHSLRAKVATLESRSRQIEQIVGGTDSEIKELRRERGRQLDDLNGAESEHESNGIKKAPSFLRKPEASSDTKPQDNGTIIAGEKLKAVANKPAAARFQPARVTSIGTDGPREIVSQQAFEGIIAQFSEFANVIRSIASLIIRHHVRALGESMEEFPQARLSELLESLSREISDDKLKADFRDRFGTA
jgi:predicted  nucleic acid-binding Zn-ribbon protein